MQALPYIALAEYIAVILLGTAAVCISTVSLLSTQVAWKKRAVQAPNRMMGLFTATAMAMTGTNAVQMTYMAALWNPLYHEHDTTLMRYIGTVSLITVNSYEISTLLLTADRCAFVLWPARRLKLEKCFFVLNLVIIGFIICGVSYLGITDSVPATLPDILGFNALFSNLTLKRVLSLTHPGNTLNFILDSPLLWFPRRRASLLELVDVDESSQLPAMDELEVEGHLFVEGGHLLRAEEDFVVEVVQLLPDLDDLALLPVGHQSDEQVLLDPIVVGAHGVVLLRTDVHSAELPRPHEGALEDAELGLYERGEGAVRLAILGAAADHHEVVVAAEEVHLLEEALPGLLPLQDLLGHLQSVSALPKEHVQVEAGHVDGGVLLWVARGDYGHQVVPVPVVDLRVPDHLVELETRVLLGPLLEEDGFGPLPGGDEAEEGF
uniref:Serpentine receptor class gamma n=1 Tax=Steinernema glaseri TaxID=37863 RepID=A0A1I8ALQ6_9BILA